MAASQSAFPEVFRVDSGFSAEAFPINANDYTTIGGKAID